METGAAAAVVAAGAEVVVWAGAGVAAAREVVCAYLIIAVTTAATAAMTAAIVFVTILTTLLTSEAIDNRDGVIANTKTRIDHLRSMDDTLYDDKLAGEITKEKYLQKHHQIQQEIETMERAMETIDDDATEQKRRDIYLTELSQ